MKIKDLMVPVSEYKTLGPDAVLSDVAAALSNSKHRDILIVDENGSFMGVLTMIDIIMALEPNYKKLSKKNLGSDVLTNKFVADIFKEFDLWNDSLADLCKKGLDIKVTDAMHIPNEEHMLNQDNDLEHGVHYYIVGAPQPLIVRQNGTVVGVLRIADVFEEITKRMNICACES